ncbi:MAG: alpha/beta fold hydrolase [Candidatus Aminicenantes bacterium]|nr:alpha/beta fold hydrolase [Candidatus Aminicenantes bacterium]
MIFLTLYCIAIVGNIYPVHRFILSNEKIEGIWQGTLRFSGMELRIIFSIVRSEDNILTATYDVPEQNVKGAQVDKITFDNGSVILEIITIQGGYKGKISEDGAEIEGNWIQGGMTLPLVLERTNTKPVFKRPQEPEEPFPYHVEEVVFQSINEGITLAGTITIPFSEGKCPAVLLLSGSGPQDRDEAIFGHRPFLVLADYLTRRGLAVLRVDDRGVGGSTGDFSEATALDYTDDALAGVAYLKSRQEIDQDLIGLIGHSEGGIIASMAAIRSSDIKFFVLMASPGMAIKDMEYSEQVRDLKAKGASDDLVARGRTVQDSLFAVVEKEKDEKVFKKKMTSILTDFFKGLSEEERKIIGLSEDNLEASIHDHFKRLNSPWFRFYLTFDPGDVLQKVKCPVLALNGGKDIQVTSKENLPAIKKALKAGGNKNFNIIELPDLNHLFQTAETGEISEYSKIEETISPAALQIISDWILQQTESILIR